MILFQVGVVVSRAAGAVFLVMALCTFLSLFPLVELIGMGGWGNSSSSAGYGGLADTYYMVSGYIVPVGAQAACGLFLILGSRITARWLIKGLDEAGEAALDKGL
jgi:hypothetical protein